MQIKHHSIYCLLFIALMLLLSSCSSNNSPENKVEQFYDFLKAGEYSKAKELYAAEARRTVEKNLPNEAFMKWANEETRQGTFETVKTINSIIRGEEATVNYAIVYKDASIVGRSVILSKEDNIWKMGLITSSFSNVSTNSSAQSNSPGNPNSPSNVASPPSTQSNNAAMTTARAQGAVDSAMLGIKKNLYGSHTKKWISDQVTSWRRRNL